MVSGNTFQHDELLSETLKDVPKGTESREGGSLSGGSLPASIISELMLVDSDPFDTFDLSDEEYSAGRDKMSRATVFEL